MRKITFVSLCSLKMLRNWGGEKASILHISMQSDISRIGSVGISDVCFAVIFMGNYNYLYLPISKWMYFLVWLYWLLSLPDRSFCAALRHLRVLLLHRLCKSCWWNRWLILVWSLFIESLRILSAFCSWNPGAVTYCNKNGNRENEPWHWGCWKSQDVTRKKVIESNILYHIITNRRKIGINSAVMKILI